MASPWVLVIVVLIVVFIVFGLLIALLSDMTAKQAVGYTFFSLGGAAAVGWALTAMGTWSHAASAKHNNALDHELNERKIFDRFIARSVLSELIGTWDTLASPIWTYEPATCMSRAVIFQEQKSGNLKIQNCCIDTEDDRIRCATADLKQITASDPTVFAVSYFPGAYAPLVVEALRDNLLILSSGDKVWLLGRRGRADQGGATEARLLEAVQAASSAVPRKIK